MSTARRDAGVCLLTWHLAFAYVLAPLSKEDLPE